MSYSTYNHYYFIRVTVPLPLPLLLPLPLQLLLNFPQVLDAPAFQLLQLSDPLPDLLFADDALDQFLVVFRSVETGDYLSRERGTFMRL